MKVRTKSDLVAKELWSYVYDKLSSNERGVAERADETANNTAVAVGRLIHLLVARGVISAPEVGAVVLLLPSLEVVDGK